MSEKEKEEPCYYAIIPSKVRYANIVPNVKLLYGEISALSNNTGYCWATNKYFAKIYKVHPTTVSSWISILVNNEFITVEIVNGQRRMQGMIHIGGVREIT